MNHNIGMSNRKHNHFESRLQDPHFTNIKMGKKRVEGRPKRGKFALMKKGDTVIWKNSRKCFMTRCERSTYSAFPTTTSCTLNLKVSN